MTNAIKRPWLLVVTIGLGTLLNPLNSSMISVALTRLQDEFSLTFAAASWLVSIFYLTSAAAQPVMGKLGDMFGAKRLFLSGLAISALASLLAVFSPNLMFLLICRALQALGSSTLYPSAMLMIRGHVTQGQGKALAGLSLFATTSAAFGPSIGGFLLSWWDWHAIFLINFPFIIVSFSLSLFILPNTRSGRIDLRRIDFSGIGLFAAAIVTLILGLLSLEKDPAWFMFGISAVTAVVFYLYEKRKQEPFIDVLTLKKNYNTTLVYAQFICISLVYYTYFFGLPAYLQQVRGLDEQKTGLVMLSLAGMGIIIAPLTGKLVDRFGAKVPLLLGAGTLTAGTVLMLTFHNHSPLGWLIAIMIILGMSSGFNNISMQRALFEQVRAEDTGSASGLFQTSRYLGAILSSSVLGIFFTGAMTIDQLHKVAVVSLIFCAVVTGLSIRIPGRNQRPAVSP
ncbi:MFS transporter [Salibacterium qingdaonense]|uniref:Predicted arabinose efflux permease, MFS family n=1 Tax=Salibacterium qingdaonense TaxID=266892 RepID=A0A1I4HT75_9BACI|nr:MFS transporter [Salibacterium qingdaonense]SFL45438.1 Predicted arabinose efflux permease, MFS family [Salibacterium qingdaonense]